jgi:hypothetical protein
MKYYHLHDNIFRTHMSARVYYRTDDHNTEHQAVVVGKNKVKPWGKIEDFEEPLDLNDCHEITKEEYYRHYDHVQFLNTLILENHA